MSHVTHVNESCLCEQRFEMRRRAHDLQQQARELDSKLAGKIELLRLATCKVTNLLSHLAELEEEEDARETPPPLFMYIICVYIYMLYIYIHTHTIQCM